MKILKIEPLQPPVSWDIDGSLLSMQSLVGGTIQILYPFAEDPDVALICKDEGKLPHLPLRPSPGGWRGILRANDLPELPGGKHHALSGMRRAHLAG